MKAPLLEVRGATGAALRAIQELQRLGRIPNAGLVDVTCLHTPDCPAVRPEHLRTDCTCDVQVIYQGANQVTADLLKTLRKERADEGR